MFPGWRVPSGWGAHEPFGSSYGSIKHFVATDLNLCARLYFIRNPTLIKLLKYVRLQLISKCRAAENRNSYTHLKKKQPIIITVNIYACRVYR